MNFSYLTTKDELKKAFSEVGLRSGMAVLLHSSMHGLGYVVNGALDVIDALLEILGESGTLLMPAHTGQLTDPTDWRNPPIPSRFCETVKQCMRQFDPKTTPVRNRGIIAQTFLSYPGVHRSSHPLNSVSAKGAQAAYFTEDHDLHSSEGIQSPIGRLYEQDGYVLLMGVDLSSCTGIHLAEFIADVPYLGDSLVKVLVRNENGSNKFVRMKRYPGTSEFFQKLLLSEPSLRATFKQAEFHSSRLIFFKLRPVIDFAVSHLREDSYYLATP
jgi:aminoglycoside 3-N-acetyltransferase